MKRLVITAVVLIGIIFYLFYPFHMQPIKIAIEPGPAYVFGISSSGYTNIMQCNVMSSDLSDDHNIMNVYKSKTMMMIGTNRRFINRYAKKLLQTQYDIKYGDMSVPGRTVVYAYTEGQRFWGRYTENERLDGNAELTQLAYRLVEIPPIRIENLYTPNTLPKEFRIKESE